MKNLIARSITGFLLVAIIVGSIVIDPYAYLVIFAAATCFALHEFYKIFRHESISPQIIPGMIIGSMLFIANFFLASGLVSVSILLFLIPAVLFIFIYELFRQKKEPFINIAMTLLGIIYIAVPLSLLSFLGFRENIYTFHYQVILGFFVLVWSYDTGAYLTGMNLGKHKLFPRLSPKKSWEGAIGGWLIALIIAWALSKTLNSLRLSDWLVMATIISVFGPLGDFIESMLKRSYNLKDSGHILPGHGGILDRFDTIFIVLPVVYVFLCFV